MKPLNAILLGQINMVARTQNRILAVFDQLSSRAPHGPKTNGHMTSDANVLLRMAEDRRLEDESES